MSFICWYSLNRKAVRWKKKKQPTFTHTQPTYTWQHRALYYYSAASYANLNSIINIEWLSRINFKDASSNFTSLGGAALCGKWQLMCFVRPGQSLIALQRSATCTSILFRTMPLSNYQPLSVHTLSCIQHSIIPFFYPNQTIMHNVYTVASQPFENNMYEC